MAAWQSRFTLLLLFVAAACAAVLLWRDGHPWLALLAAAAIVHVHALVLAFEFGLMAMVSRHDASPRPSLNQCIRAWWGEVCAVSRAFGWRLPWRERAIADSDAQARPGRRGVLLVHGFLCNRGVWNPWLRRLRAQGVPCVAVSMEPVFGSIDRYVPAIEAAVKRLEAATGLPPIIVAHSMGGLVVRCWLTAQQDDARVHRVLTLGSPHHGTWIGRWVAAPNGRQMRLASAWRSELRSRERGYAKFTCYYSHCDNIVFPATTATLQDADNRHLPATAHLQMLAHPEPFAELERRLA